MYLNIKVGIWVFKYWYCSV